jgi:hypothetical protein
MIVDSGMPSDSRETFRPVGYANDKVVEVVQRSDSGFAGLVGLPLLRLMEYGGNAETF